MEQNYCVEYISPRPFVKKYKVIPERMLRRMIAEGKVPGIQTTKGFKINTGLFLEQLDTICKSNVTGGVSI